MLSGENPLIGFCVLGGDAVMADRSPVSGRPSFHPRNSATLSSLQIVLRKVARP